MTDDVQVGARVRALAEALELADGVLLRADLDDATRVVERAGARLRHGTDHTVVALAGPTGAGKSSLFNALAGADVSTTGVRRPTTAEAHAAVWGAGASDLLGWLGVRRQHHVAGQPDLDGLVLVDLPDFDSTEAAHRVEVDRLVELVDLIVWIVDPEKYADESLHHGYLRPLAGHASVMSFVLSKVDTVPEGEADGLVADLAARLREDGIDRPRVVAVSIPGGRGVDEVRALLGRAVGERAAAIARIEADVRDVAAFLAPPDTEVGIPPAARDELIEALGRAAGLDDAAAVVAAQHRRDAALATGWPLTRGIRRLRRAPIRDLPTPGRSAVAEAEVAGAVRAVAEAMAPDEVSPWTVALRRAAEQRADRVVERLDTVTAGAARTQRDRPRWWRLAGALQLVLALVAGSGFAWLLATAFGGGFLQLDTDPLLPEWRDVPLPTWLLVGGVASGWLLATLARRLAGVGARRRARRLRRDLAAHVAQIADREVISVLDALADERRRIVELLAVAAA